MLNFLYYALFGNQYTLKLETQKYHDIYATLEK